MQAAIFWSQEPQEISPHHQLRNLYQVKLSTLSYHKDWMYQEHGKIALKPPPPLPQAAIVQGLRTQVLPSHLLGRVSLREGPGPRCLCLLLPLTYNNRNR